MEEPNRETRAKLLQILTPFLARRDYSETELRAKLASHLPASEVEDAIHLAREKRWLHSADDLRGRLIESLNEKKKGALFIANQLREKGLPEFSVDPAIELRKAQDLIASKLAHGAKLDYEGRLKLRRFLISRGFETEIIDHCLGGSTGDPTDEIVPTFD